MSTSRKGRTTAETKKAAEEIEAANRSRPQLSASDRELREKRTAEIKDKTKGITVAQVVQQLAGVSTSVQDALATVSKDLTERVRQLELVGEALVISQAELEEIHGKEILASSIDDLLEERNHAIEEGKKRLLELNEQAREQERLLNQQFNQLRETKTAEWKREQEQYEYGRAQARKVNEDKYLEERRVIALKNADEDRRIALDRDEREKALAAQEAEYKKAIEALANLEATIKKASDAAVAVATSSLKKDLTHTFEMEKSGLTNQISNLSNTVAAKDIQINDLKDQVAKLQHALDQSRQAQLDLATKTVEGAHATKAMAEFGILMGQGGANGPSQGRKA